ncbi:cellulose biosynthesis protein BcsN [Rhizobium sp. SGZ-381]|uniref:cellulose biosynthesis protein BcsN n=1 Tax=Rhizobium sp. SGZ-381 TaxID=3342800 RepID=UPI00366FC433
MRAASLYNVVAGVLASTILAGCQTAAAVKTPAAPELVAPEKALIMPPPGGLAMVGVVEHAYGNGIEQTVLLATSSSVIGQNYLKIRYNGGNSGETGSVAYRPITESSLRSERAAALPGIRLTPSMNFLRNAYGPIGYASGKSAGGDTCLFGWQQIRSRSTGSGMGRDFGMIQVRVRLCDHAASERELLNYMYGYTITGTFQGQIWNPYGAPPPVSDSLAYAGPQVLPPADTTPGYYSFGYRPQAPAALRAPVRQALAPVARAPDPGPAVVVVPGPGATIAPVTATPASSAPSSVATTAPSSPLLVPSPQCLGSTPAPNGSACAANDK